MNTDITRRKFLKLGVYGGLGCLVASYPFFIERYLLQVNTYNIPVRNLPEEFDNFKIVQLTDLHYGKLMPEFFIERIIDKANSLGGDSIVCTGDYILNSDYGSQSIKTVWSMIKRLKAKYGVYSVLGNHDHWANFNKSLECLNDSGQNIRHKAISIERNMKKIWIGGAGDLWEDELGIDTAFREVPSKDCKILLAHNPDTADTQYTTRIDLMISGHTHGGQVNIPFLGAPVLPVNNKSYSSGYIRSQHTDIFISRGIGWAIIPIRWNCYPEIAVLNFKKA